MKTAQYSQLERKRLLEVVREYQSKGYGVELETKKFPSPFQQFSPDLIAVSNDDSVVVEVVSKQSIGNRERLESLSRLVQTMPGWRFELIVTNPQQQFREDISLDEIKNRLTQAIQLDRQGISSMALLGAWSATEALLRRVAVNEGLEVASSTPLRLVKTLYSLGALTRSEYESLEAGAEMRNILVHGFELVEDRPIRRDLLRLIEAANGLLSRIETESTIHDDTLTVEQLVEWFLLNYEDPAIGVPYEGGYLYILGGPYDPQDELASRFPNASEELVKQAADIITREGAEWVRRGQY